MCFFAIDKTWLMK